MSPETFTKAIEMVPGDYVSIGGGEPTIHPLFWQFLGQALGTCEGVWLATNGKETRTALALAGLAKGSEMLSVALSQDQWHENINPIVVDAFRKAGLELRNVGRNGQEPFAVGRGKNISERKGCVCEDHIILPNGDIRACGCPRSPIIGDVFSGISDKYRDIIESEEFQCSQCWTSYKERKGKK